ncbi:MAG: hypothetical protein KAI64_00385, partial [Thermoplasmata archaeon]|nr:hypothetical protein [Thermoplasmata archaeon]
MLYFDGDNNLEKFGVNDFLELSAVGSTPDVNILVQFDRRSGYDTRFDDWTDAKRFFVKKNMTPTASNATQSLGEVDMADPQVLEDFLIWGAENYTAEKYFLVIWDHGRGWEGIIEDSSSGGSMKTPELAGALAQFHALKGIKIDVIAFDACRMMLEMVYEMKDHADYFVGSEKDVPDRGFPYDMLLERITADPYVSAWNAARILVDVYADFYTDNTNFAVTLSAIDSSRFGSIGTDLNTFLNETFLELPFYSTEIQSARNGITEANGGKFEGDYQYDLHYFLEKVQEEVGSKRLDDLAEDVKELIKNCVYEKKWDNPSSKNSRATNANGLTIWLPPSMDQADYLNLQFAQDTYWDEFLDLYNLNYQKPQANLTVGYSVNDTEPDGYNDTVDLYLLSNTTANMTVELYTNKYQFSKEYGLTTGVQQNDTIPLSNNGYYTLHFYLTNSTGHLLNYSEIINPFSSYVDLVLDPLYITIWPHSLSCTFGNVETINATIINYGPLDALDINVSFWASFKIGGESPDENDDGQVDNSYTGRLIGWTTVDISADLSDYQSSDTVSILWDLWGTNFDMGTYDIWITVDYPAPGDFNVEEDEVQNNKARYWTGNYSVVGKFFSVKGTVQDDEGAI